MKKTYFSLCMGITAAIFFSGCSKNPHLNIIHGGDGNPPPSTLLHYASPTLVDPVIVHVGGTSGKVSGQADRDLLIIFDSKLTTELDVNGNKCRNIIIKGGEIEIPGAVSNRRSAYFKDWKGVFHVEGLWIHRSATNVDGMEGINIDSRNAGCTFQIQNSRIDGIIGNAVERAAYTAPNTFHPDIIQNWGGPAFFYMDRFTGETDYQGFMMQPLQYGTVGTTVAEFRNVNILRTNTGNGGYTIYRASGTTNVYLNNFYVTPSGQRKGYPENDLQLQAMLYGIPQSGDFVTANTTGGVAIAGMGYISPGYKNAVQVAYPTLHLGYPNETVNLSAGQTINVAWTYTGLVGGINIDFSRDGGTTWERLVSATSILDGIEAVTLPSSGATTYNALIRVSGATGQIFDHSDKPFAMLASQTGWNSTSNWASTGTVITNLPPGNSNMVTVNYDITSQSNNIDGFSGFTGSSIVATTYGFGNFPLAVRMAPTGFFDARNGADYGSVVQVPYELGKSYHIRIVANLPNRTYNVWVKPSGGDEVQIATNFSFRTGSPAIADIGKMANRSNVSNEFSVNNLVITSQL